MSKVSLGGSPTGTATFDIVAPATNTNRVITLPDSSGQVSVLDLRTAVTASGTAVDFLNIPATARRVTVMFNGVSTNGTSSWLIQLGDSGGVETTGYLGSSTSLGGGATTALYTTGIGIFTAAATRVQSGAVTLFFVTGNTWAAQGVTAASDGAVTQTTAGTKTLSGTLDRIRITTLNGTDVFDAGTINIMVE